jgi:hypothetical protein
MAKSSPEGLPLQAEAYSAAKATTLTLEGLGIGHWRLLCLATAAYMEPFPMAGSALITPQTVLSKMINLPLRTRLAAAMHAQSRGNIPARDQFKS